MVASGIGVSVISAAILEGNLILGLSDGSVINAGVAQGPMGLTGPQGPVGATGRPGRDGNTIHSVEGAPSYDLGTDGDFAINTVEWEVYGPKASGQWGKGTPMIGGGGRNKREVNKGGDTRTDSGGGENRPPIISPDGDLTPPTQYPGAKPIREGDFWVDGNGALHVYYRGQWNKVRVYSDMVLPAGDAPSGSSRDVEGSVTVPGNGGTGQAIAEAANGEQFRNQYEYNNWVYYRVDRPPIVADDEPAEHPNFPVTGLNTGDFWINAGNQLFTWKANQWTPLFAKGLLTVQDTMPDPATSQEGELWFNTEETHLTLYVFTQPDPNEEGLWVPASPPVSLDGVEDGLKGLTYAVDELTAITTNQGRDIADAKSTQYGIAKALEHLDNDQKRQDEQLAEIAGEIEDLQPSIERGEWVYEPNPEGPNSPAPGGYTAYVMVTEDFCKAQHSECLMNTGGDQALATECNRNFDSCLAKVGEADTDVPWHEVEWLVLHRNDIEGRNHLFGDVTPDMYVEALNADGTGHGLYQIITKTVDPRKCGLHVKPVHSSGHPNGKALFKIFKMADAANPEDYVRREGDEMVGPLHIESDSRDSNPAFSVQPKELEHSNSDIVQVRDKDGKLLFFVSNGGNVAIGSQSTFTPKRDHDLTTKAYVDGAAAPGPVTFSWKYTGPDTQSNNLKAGEFYGPKKPVFDGSKYFSWYFHNTPAQPAGNNFGAYQNDLKYGFNNYQVLGSFWFNDSGTWKQKGHFWVKSVEYNYKSRAVLCVSGYHIRNSDDTVNEFVSQFTEGKIYGLTIGGFF